VPLRPHATSCHAPLRGLHPVVPDPSLTEPVHVDCHRAIVVLDRVAHRKQPAVGVAHDGRAQEPELRYHRLDRAQVPLHREACRRVGGTVAE
jgi:hypothetical protein